MDVVVCVKQIPDPADPGELNPDTKTLKRDTKLILDESDSYGVEMALQLVDAAGSGEVRLVSMTPGGCLLYTSPSPRDGLLSRMPSSA
mgnify:CR=1 FL=1